MAPLIIFAQAVDEGTLAAIVVEEGTENVAVGAVIAMLAEEGEDVGDVSAPSGDAASAPAPSPAPAPAAAASDDGPAATPTARKLAEANGIDLGQIEGTGPKGKITKGDVEEAMGGGGAASVTGASPTPSPAPSPAPASSGDRIIAGGSPSKKVSIWRR